MQRRTDNLASAREAGRWLSTLTRDSEIACGEVASALTDAERFGPFSPERHQAVLLVDKWATPLQEQLLTEYPFAGRDRAAKLASTLRRIAESFGRYYDELIEALRAVPRDRDHPHLSYVALVRRLAHVRYECVLHALGQLQPPNWHRTHRMQRMAAQELSRDGSRSTDDIRAAALGTSAEAEYIQILLTDRLAGVGLEPAEVLCAVGWLGRWVDLLSISTEPRSRNAFVIYPTGSEGLSAPPRVLTAGLLWLDVAPLHLQIRRELRREPDATELDDGFGLSAERRRALLERLLQVWQGPHGSDARRDPRRRLHKQVQVAFGLAGIFDAIRLSETIAKELREADAAAANGRPTLSPLARWVIVDVSDSGCRIRGETQAVASLAIGTPAAIRVDANDSWVVGIVRRRGPLDGTQSDLGIELIATRVKLLAIRERADAEAGSLRGSAAAGKTATEHAAGRTALLLGPAPRSTVRQSVLVNAEDFGPGRIWFCDTRRHRYKLTLQQPLERNARYVLATLSVAKIAQLVPGEARPRGTPGRDDTLVSS